jgi:hypothetical protein
MSLGSHETVEIMVYLNFLLVGGRIRILKALKHRYDRDPEHLYRILNAEKKFLLV